MNSSLKVKIIFISASMLLLFPSLASADTPKPKIHNSQVLPYLLDNANTNPVVRVRCLPKYGQQTKRDRAEIRNYLLQSNSGTLNADTVTIEIAGNCRYVKIGVQDDASFNDYPVYNPNFDDNSWVTRKGSGWYWLLRHP